jgi:hypothetical protein
VVTTDTVKVDAENEGAIVIGTLGGILVCSVTCHSQTLPSARDIPPGPTMHPCVHPRTRLIRRHGS